MLMVKWKQDQQERISKAQNSALVLPYPLFFTKCLPPPSTPRATGHNPAETTAADPLEEPPVTLPVS